MAQKHGKSARPLNDLVAEIERSRRELSLGLRQVGEGLDIPARLSRSIARQPVNWAVGLLMAGLVTIGVGAAGSRLLRQINHLRPKRPATSDGDQNCSGPSSFRAAGSVSKGSAGRGALRGKTVLGHAVHMVKGIARRALFRAVLELLARKVFGEAIFSRQKGGARGFSLGRNPPVSLKELSQCLIEYLERWVRKG